MKKAKVTNETIINFLKALEKENMVIRGTHTQKDIVAVVKEAVLMPYEEVVKLNKPSILFFNTEFSDWIETYDKD